MWNGLPSDVTSASSLSVFNSRLKTYLFRRYYETVLLSITFPFPSHYLPPQNSGLRNSFYCLGHFKNVYDDDLPSPTLISSPFPPLPLPCRSKPLKYSLGAAGAM